MRTVILAACCVLASAGLAIRTDAQSGVAQGTKGSAMDRIAEQYVKLVLALGQHDADYVDAYYGPPEWKKDTSATKIDLDTIAARAQALILDIARERSGMRTPTPGGDDEMMALRVQYLDRQLSALSARVRMLKGSNRPPRRTARKAASAASIGGRTGLQGSSPQPVIAASHPAKPLQSSGWLARVL